MSPPTLQQLAMRAAIRNRKDINDISGLDYRIIRPFLLKIDNPQQLRRLEISEPSLCPDTAELWRTLIKRDCPSWEKNPIEPKDPSKWYKIYERVIKAEQERLNQHSSVLQQRLETAQLTKKQNSTEFGAARKLPKGKTRSITPAAKSREPSSGPFGSLPKGKTFSGRSILEKARKEARESNRMQLKAVMQQRTTAPTIAQQSAPKRPSMTHANLGLRPPVPPSKPAPGPTHNSGLNINVQRNNAIRSSPTPPKLSRPRPATNIFMTNTKKRRLA